MSHLFIFTAHRISCCLNNWRVATTTKLVESFSIVPDTIVSLIRLKFRRLPISDLLLPVSLLKSVVFSLWRKIFTDPYRFFFYFSLLNSFVAWRWPSHFHYQGESLYSNFPNVGTEIPRAVWFWRTVEFLTNSTDANWLNLFSSGRFL